MASVVSLGQIASLDRPSLPQVGRLQLSDHYAADYATLWKTQPHVRTVCDFLARNIAQIGLHVYERTSDTDRRRLRAGDSTVAAVLAKPSPYMTPYRMLDSLVHDLAIYDVTCWVRVGGEALFRLPPWKVSPRGDSWLEAEQIRFRGSRGVKDFPRDQVVLIHGYSPVDSRWGTSPMETLRQVLAEEWSANQYRQQLWKNGARFPGTIKRPLGAKWSDEARSRFRDDWKGLYTGDGPGAGGTPVLEDGMEFVANGITPLQAQYLESRKLTREEVAAAYHIPAPFVGILDHATFSNITEQHKNLYQDTLGPWLEQIEQELDLQLVNVMDDSGRVYVEFNLAEKMKGSFEEQAQTLQTSVGAPWLTRNEARARQNLPAVPGGDELVTPLNVLVGGQASPTDSAPKTQADVSVKAKPASFKPGWEAKYSEVLANHLNELADYLSSGSKDAGADWRRDWEKTLAANLMRLHLRVSVEAAHRALEAAGFDPDDYDESLTLAYLSKWAAGDAERYSDHAVEVADHAETEDGETISDAVRRVLDGEKGRTVVSAASMVTAVAAWGVAESGKQTGGATKTWIVTSGNARPSHAAIDGETVPLDDVFSNGLKWPGDGSVGDADEVAGCTCELEINYSTR